MNRVYIQYWNVIRNIQKVLSFRINSTKLFNENLFHLITAGYYFNTHGMCVGRLYPKLKMLRVISKEILNHHRQTQHNTTLPTITGVAVQPYALGQSSLDPSNVQCRQVNSHMWNFHLCNDHRQFNYNWPLMDWPVNDKTNPLPHTKLDYVPPNHCWDLPEWK